MKLWRTELPHSGPPHLFDTSDIDPAHDLYYPMRGYVEQVQHRIDDSFDILGMARKEDTPCRG